MENKSFFLSICYLLLPCCFSPVFVKASREAEILRGRSEQGSAAWELPLPPSDFDPPVNSSSSSSSSSFCLSCAPFFLKVRTQGLQSFFCNALHAPGFSKAYKSFAMHSVFKASKGYKSFCNALCAQGFQCLQVFCNALHVQGFQGLHDFHNALRPKSYKFFTMHCIE